MSTHGGDEAQLRYEYRCSEGVVLRAPVDYSVKLEAWGPRRGRWFVYPEIDRDWVTNSRPISEASVPDDARNAPSSYESGISPFGPSA